MVVVEGAGQFVLIVRLPDPRGHKRVGVPVRRERVHARTVGGGLLAIAAAVDKNAAQRFVAARCRQAIVPTAVRRVILAAVAKSAGFAWMQIVVRRFRLEGDVAADGSIGGLGVGRARLNIHAAVHVRVNIVAADAEGVLAGAADVAAAGGVRLRNAVDVDADAVALKATNVVAGVAAAVEAAFAVAGSAASAGRADQRFITHNGTKIVGPFVLKLLRAYRVLTARFKYRCGGGDGHLFRAVDGGFVLCFSRARGSLIDCCEQRGHQ